MAAVLSPSSGDILTRNIPEALFRAMRSCVLSNWWLLAKIDDGDWLIRGIQEAPLGEMPEELGGPWRPAFGL